MGTILQGLGHLPSSSLSNLVPTGEGSFINRGEMLMLGVWPEEKWFSWTCSMHYDDKDEDDKNGDARRS